MRTLRLGLVGAGGIGRVHRDAMAILDAEGNATLAAVADISPQILSEIQDDPTWDRVRCFSDYRRMLAEAELDAVVLASPIPLHFEMTQELLRRRIPFLLEKPPFPLIQQLDEVCALPGAERVAVCFQMICSRPGRLMKQRIIAGDIGTLQEIRIAGLWPRRSSYYCRSPWAGRMMHAGRAVFDGPATNAFAHLIHHAMFLAGEGEHGFSQPQEVWGEFYRARVMESYDFAALRGRFADGVRFTATLGHCAERILPFRVEAKGSHGWLQWDEDGRVTSHEGMKEDHDASPVNLFVGCYRDFLAFCRGEVDRPATRLADTRGYVLATNAALVSSGGIHTVSPAYTETYCEGDDTGVILAGLDEAMRACLDHGLLPSEHGAPWARAGRPQATSQFSFLRLNDHAKRALTIRA